MRKLVINIFVLVWTCWLAGTVMAAEIAVVQGARIPAYEAAVAGFEQELLRDIPTGGVKRIEPHTFTTYILSETANKVELRQEIGRHRPDLILAVGSSSLGLVKNIGPIPVVYLLVPFPELLVSKQDQVTGVGMLILAARQLAAFKKILPDNDRIGLLYTAANTDRFVAEAMVAARQQGLNLIALPIQESREVPGLLAGMRSDINAFWMLPDPAVVTPQTIDAIMLFSLENRVPVLTFSEKYLDLGAVLAVSFEPRDLGRQAGELAREIIRGRPVSALPPRMAEQVKSMINRMAADKLGIRVHDPDAGEDGNAGNRN